MDLFFVIGLLVILCAELFVMYRLWITISSKENFRYFSRNIWLVVITLGNVFGQMLYLLLERDNDRQRWV